MDRVHQEGGGAVRQAAEPVLAGHVTGAGVLSQDCFASRDGHAWHETSHLANESYVIEENTTTETKHSVKNDTRRTKTGLSREVSEICTQLGIQDVNETYVPKSQIKTAVFNHHYTEMMEEIKKD